MFQLQTEFTFSVSVLSYIGLPRLPWQSWICRVENAAKRILHQLLEQGYLD
jgi:ABC-type cobalamin/Fe3+-siderophores transport system ATPase subunit